MLPDNAEDLKEDHHGKHKDDGNNDTDTVHLYSCIYCATGVHGQCRGVEYYKGNRIRCECFDKGHPT